MLEVYKYLNGLLPQLMNDIFRLIKNTYNLTQFHFFERQNRRTKRYRVVCIAYTASQISQTFPIEIRDTIFLKIFKHKIKA